MIHVRGVGFHFPEKTISTRELIRSEQLHKIFGVGLLDDIGCEQIHVASPSESPSSLAAIASTRALEHAKLDPSELDLVVGVSCTPPDFDLWSQPAKIAQRIGASRAEAIGVGEAGCAGAFAAMRAVVPMMLAPGGPRRALVAAGCVTPGGHIFPPATVFGDGAGAMVLERAEGAASAPRVVRADFYSHTEYIDAFGCLAGVDMMREEGMLERRWWSVSVRDPDVYSALRTANFDLGAKDLMTSLDRAGWPVESLTWLVPDNVSAKVGQELAARVGLPADRVLSENCARYGHAFVADLFVNLRTIVDLHPMKPNDRIACVGMGLGQHWGVTLIEL